MVETVATCRFYKNYKKANYILSFEKGFCYKAPVGLEVCRVSGATGMHHCIGVLIRSCRSEASVSNKAQYKNAIIENIAKAFNILQHPFLI